MSWQRVGTIAEKHISNEDEIHSFQMEIASLKAEMTQMRDSHASALAEIRSLPSPVDGKDGLGLSGAVIDRNGHLVLTLSDGQTKDVGVVVGSSGQDGRDGSNGVDGKDGQDAIGLGLDDLEEEGTVDPETKLATITFRRGEHTKSVRFRIPMLVDRGVYDWETSYQAGDVVSWDGSIWIATAPTTARPGLNTESSKLWRLSVKRGQQGKPGKPGENGRDGQDGRPGKDLTSYDGSKWGK